jgi:hypothetical protein
MNGQNTGAEEGKKPKAWAWQEIIIAIVAVACILFSTVIVARGVDTASIPSQTRHAGSRANLHHSATSALSAAANAVGIEKLREEARYMANGLTYRCNVSSFPSMNSFVAGAQRPFAALFGPILHSGQ